MASKDIPNPAQNASAANTYEGLIERLEKAIGPDADLDEKIHRKFDPENSLWLDAREADVNDSARRNGFSEERLAERAPAIHRAYWNCPRYTGSIDAAVALLALVRPGYSWNVGFYRSCNEPFVRLWFVNGDECTSFDADAATPAISLCLAIVHALAARQSIKTGE